MTLSELRTMMDDFGVYLDNYKGTGATSAQKTSQINWAIRQIGQRLFMFNPRVTLTVTAPITSTNGAIFNLRDATATNAKMWKIIKVFIENSPLLDYNGRPGLVSFADFERWNPSWRTESTGRPTRAVQISATRLLLSPPPAGTETNTFVSGYYIPADLTNSTDDAVAPDIPEELHECLAYYAAQHVAMPTATEQEQWAKLAAYKDEWTERVDFVAKTNRSVAEGWDSFGHEYPRYMLS